MARIYPVPFQGTVTAAGGNVDLFSIQPAANKPVALRGFTLGQVGLAGDAAEKDVQISVLRLPATFTVGSGGSAVTAAPPQESSSMVNWSFTARVNDATVATTSGTSQILDTFGWNQRSTPYERWYPDEDSCPSAINGQGLVIRQDTAVAADYTFAGIAFVEEEG